MAQDGRIVGLERATLKTLSAGDAKVMGQDISAVVSAHKEPMVAELIAKNAPLIQALVEAVNDNSKQGYGGLAADGGELTLQWLNPQDFAVSGVHTNANYSGWQRWLQAGSIETLIGGTTLEEEGLIIFGWANNVSWPVADAIKLYKGTEESVVEPLSWIRKTVCCKGFDPIKAAAMSGISVTEGGCTDWTQNAFYGGGAHDTPIVEMRKPLLVPPETTWRVDVKYISSGVDGLQPLGFRVRTASAAWNLAF